MALLMQRTFRDMRENRFLNLVTIATVALSILIVSAFSLFVVNANELLASWRRGVRMLVYLERGLSRDQELAVKRRLLKLPDVTGMQYVSREAALQQLKEEMPGQVALFTGLKENPLPDTFEIRLAPAATGSHAVLVALADRVAGIQGVDDVAYGQEWLGKFANVVNLLKLCGSAMGGLFMLAVVVIVANTVRLTLYARREEIEIMRLVGATDSFIHLPFYIQGMVQGVLGGIAGVAILYLVYLYIVGGLGHGIPGALFTPRFLSPVEYSGIIFGSVLVGWFGCYLSLKQLVRH